MVTSLALLSHSRVTMPLRSSHGRLMCLGLWSLSIRVFNWWRHRFKIPFLEFLGSDVLQSSEAWVIYTLRGWVAPVVRCSCSKWHEYSQQGNRQWQAGFPLQSQFAELPAIVERSLGCDPSDLKPRTLFTYHMDGRRERWEGGLNFSLVINKYLGPNCHF